MGWGPFALFRRKSLLEGIQLFVLMAMVFGVVCLLYMIASRHSPRWDLTEGGRYSLSLQSRDASKQLAPQAEFHCFFREGDSGRRPLRELLELYQHENPRLKVSFWDPDREPLKTRLYKVDTYGTVIVEAGDRREKVDAPTEEGITNALLRLVRGERKKIYFLTGHGERILADTERDGVSILVEQLGGQNSDAQPLTLAREGGIPQDASSLAIVGAETDYFPEELKLLDEYLARGGSLGVFLDPVPAETLPRLEAFLESHGVRTGHDMIVDRLSRVFGADYLIPVITSYEPHAITKRFNVACFLPVTRSVEPVSPRPPGITESMALAFTSPDSWAERDLALLELGQAKLDRGVDRQGPVPVAVVAEGPASVPVTAEAAGKPPKTWRMAVYGDSDFLANANLRLSGNKDLALNTMAWLSGVESLITIRPKDVKSTPLYLSPAQQRLLLGIDLIALPGGAFLLGLVVVLRRRRFA